MGLEIERKYLVNKEKWDKVNKTKKQFMRQGYLIADPKKTIRVRLAGNQGFLTIKGLSVGATRPEFEYKIPKNDAVRLLENFAVAGLTKVRYYINYKNKVWEVDEFAGENSGLIIAEIELSSENEQYEIPEWIEKEVTGEAKYYNSNLSKNPYKNW